MKPRHTLSETLTTYADHAVDLLENAVMMGLNQNGEWDKLPLPKLKKTMADTLLADPLPILRQLPREDLELLKSLTEAAPGDGVIGHVPQQILTMTMLGLVSQMTYDEYESLEMFLIPEDFKAAILPHLDAVMDDMEVKIRFVAEEYLIGALNLYGVLTADELKKTLKECLLLEDDGSGMFDFAYARSIALRMAKIDVPYASMDNTFVSPLVCSFADIIKERDTRKDNTTFKHFTPNDIRQAGEMPMPCIPNPVNSKMMHVLQSRLGYSNEEAHYRCLMLWQTVQEETATIAIQELLENAPKGEDMKSINAALPIISDYLNNAPRWIFRGYCPNDLFVPQTSAPTITLGSGMRAAGFDVEELQQEVNRLWNQPKVGRNAPCPCGSGKKFKHCCGRNT